MKTALCNYGNCTVWMDDQGRVDGAVGPVGCPCDNTRGWNRRYLDQMGKPHPPVKSRSWKVKRREREAKELARFQRQLEAM